MNTLFVGSMTKDLGFVSLDAYMAEFGGATAQMVSIVQIICNENYTKPMASYTPSKGELACGKHAFIHVKPGMYVIRVERYIENYHIEVYQIESVQDRGQFQLIFLGNLTKYFLERDQDKINCPFLPEGLLKVICVAMAKSWSFKCKVPYYVTQKGHYDYGSKIYDEDSNISVLHTPIEKLIGNIVNNREQYRARIKQLKSKIVGKDIKSK